MGTGIVGSDAIVVRNLRAADLEAVIAIDARSTGRRREEFFKPKLDQVLNDTGIAVSLAAELGGSIVGFLLARVYYGEFGIVEPVAVLDGLGIHPDFSRRGAAAALLEQLKVNLRGLGIGRLRTEVSWDHLELIGFFHREGFRPAPRLCLELGLQEQNR